LKQRQGETGFEPSHPSEVTQRTQSGTESRSEAARKCGAASGRSRENLNAVLMACFGSAARGRLAALGDIYDLVAGDLYGYLRGILGSAADAEDVLQEVFAKLAAQGPRLVGVERPLPYIFAVARNEALLVKRRSRGHDGYTEGPLLEEIAAPASARPTITAAEVEEALRAIPVEWREVVILKVYEGFTLAEIGELTGTSPNTVASRYRYALARLAQRLRRRPGD